MGIVYVKAYKIQHVFLGKPQLVRYCLSIECNGVMTKHDTKSEKELDN